MGREFSIVYAEEPAWETIGGAIHHYNNQQAGDSNGQNLCFVLQSPEGEVMGGVIGETHWNWLYISLMWVREDLRSKGYGRQLLTFAENEGRQRGANRAYLDTFSFQAPDFYRKLGYEVFGELREFPPGHQRYYMVKDLSF